MKNENIAKLGLLVRLQSKPGKETEVENFLRSGLSIVQAEPGTTVWFAIRLGTSTFGIFDTFPDEASRQQHLTGKVAEALFAQAPELFSQPPVVEMFESLVVKLPV